MENLGRTIYYAANQTGKIVFKISEPNAVAQQLSEIDNDLHQLICAHRFYREAIEAVTASSESDFNQDWHYGLVIVGEWLQQHGDALLHQVSQLQLATERNG